MPTRDVCGCQPKTVAILPEQDVIFCHIFEALPEDGRQRCVSRSGPPMADSRRKGPIPGDQVEVQRKGRVDIPRKRLMTFPRFFDTLRAITFGLVKQAAFSSRFTTKRPPYKDTPEYTIGYHNLRVFKRTVLFFTMAAKKGECL